MIPVTHKETVCDRNWVWVGTIFDEELTSQLLKRIQNFVLEKQTYWDTETIFSPE